MVQGKHPRTRTIRGRQITDKLQSPKFQSSHPISLSKGEKEVEEHRFGHSVIGIWVLFTLLNMVGVYISYYAPYPFLIR
jgi:hypothetical protein